jgi:hypothetical protein
MTLIPYIIAVIVVALAGVWLVRDARRNAAFQRAKDRAELEKELKKYRNGEEDTHP